MNDLFEELWYTIFIVVFCTLKEMDILRNETKTKYVLYKIPITYDKVLDFVIAQGMKLDGSSYYSYTELDHLNILFPFAYQTKKRIANAE